MNEAQRLAQKSAFFNDLEALEKDDEGYDAGLHASIAAMRSASLPEPALDREKSLHGEIEDDEKSNPPSLRSRFASSRPEDLSAEKLDLTRSTNDYVTTEKNDRRGHSRSAVRRLTRSHTVPEQSSSTSESIILVKDTPVRSVHPAPPPQLRHSATDPSTVPSTSTDIKPTLAKKGKRKRSDQLQQVPEGQQLFSGLKFFFVPNNDVNKARKMRIEKAVQYGASWIREWRQEVTHIVVDNDLSYPEVLKFLRIAELPGGVTLVNERYPGDCLLYKYMVNAHQLVYQVRGHAFTTSRAQSVDSTAPSQTSLQIKSVKAKEDVMVYAACTPSRADDESAEGSCEQLLLSLGRSEDEVIHKQLDTSVNSDEDGDLLQQAITKVKATEHLPIDSDDEDLSRPSTAEASEESDCSDSEAFPKTKSKNKGTSNAQHIFACMHEHDPSKTANNPNARTIQILQEMASYYESTSDQWRTVAYRKAIASLRKQAVNITTKEAAERLPFIGSRLAAKIEEIVWTNRLRRLDAIKLEPTDHAMQLFTTIYGVGYNQASKWIQQGYRSIADLLAHAKLTDPQRLGIEHLDDFQSRIPRGEVVRHGDTVRRALLDIDPAFQVTVGGSYRRGAVDSGDIDLLITKPGASAVYLRSVVIEMLVPRLFAQGFLTAGLAVTAKDDGSKWHGACQLPADNDTDTGASHVPRPWRRIDLLLVPWEELGAAMIYFTGNDIFNRSLRLLARTKGMRLNQRGLYKDCIKGPGQIKLTEGTLVEGRSERGIFRALGVPWREAGTRNC